MRLIAGHAGMMAHATTSKIAFPASQSEDGMTRALDLH
jgi:hypothetical protein